MQRLTWHELLARNIRGHTILLDVDGVLMADGEDTVPPEIAAHVKELTRHNDVIVVSNTFRRNRVAYVHRLLGIPYAKTPLKKPSVRILTHILYDPRKPMLVIGDKVLTDALFAHRIGAACVLLHRRTHPNDRVFIKLTYALDELFAPLVDFWYAR